MTTKYHVRAQTSAPPGTHVRLLVWPDSETSRTADTAIYLSTTRVLFPEEAS